jgi:hypothetical protein
VSESNFTALSGSLGSPSVLNTVSHGPTPPNGASSGVRVFRSTVATLGVAGEYCNVSGINPTNADQGIKVEIAFRKANLQSADKYAPFLAIMLQGNSVSSQGYILGLTDSATPKLCLRKGQLSGGLPASAAIGEQGVLMLSEATYALGAWVHVQFQAVVNPGSDTVIQVKTNNLAVNAVGSPVWTYPAGMEGNYAFDATFVDDLAGAASGSPAFTTGRFALGMWTNETNRIAHFDYQRLIIQ